MEYTLTIEQTGGNAMVVPGRGFLLNNELTDFNFTPTPGHRARPEPARRRASGRAARCRRRSCSTTASRSWRVGSPGGSTIITTVLQILVNRIDLGMTLPEAIAAPRATQRNTAAPQAEPAFITAYEDDLVDLGQPRFCEHSRARRRHGDRVHPAGHDRHG